MMQIICKIKHLMVEKESSPYSATFDRKSQIIVFVYIMPFTCPKLLTVLTTAICDFSLLKVANVSPNRSSCHATKGDLPNKSTKLLMGISS